MSGGSGCRMLWIGWLGVLLALGIPFGLGLAARAQGAAIECDTVPRSAASPAALPAAASPPAPVAFPEDGGEVVVFAAASLTDAFAQITADLEAAHPALTISVNFAGSQALVTQLSGGAEADVFAAADTAQMDAAIDAGVIEGKPVIFVHNRLAVVVPANNPADIQRPADLARDDLKLVLAAPEVPAGRYARQSMCAMGADVQTYGAEFVERVAANVVSNEEHVRAVLTKVQLGEADAGIVYTSDVAAGTAEDVTLIEIPEAVNVVAHYPIAPVAGGDQELARAFIAYVLGPQGQATLQAFGFDPAFGNDDG